MTKIYWDSLRFFLASLPALLLFALMIEGLFWVWQPRSEGSVSFVALTIIAYYFHRHFLFGETLGFRNQKPADGAPPYKFGWFLLISGGLLLVPLGLALSLFSVQRAAPVLIVLYALPVYLLTLSLFGLSLPAVVARDGTYRPSQGLRAAFGTAWRLILGPGVVGALMIALAVIADRALRSVPEDSLILLASFTVLRTLGFLTTIFAVAVLCDMYHRTRPKPRAGDLGHMGQTAA